MEFSNSMFYSRQDRSFSLPNISISMICQEEPISDVQFKAYKTRLHEYKNFLDNVNRLASCVNVCITEEPVNVGENGLLTGEALNALQHAGSISVYNFFQQHNWEYPANPEGEMAVIRPHNPVTDEFLDSEQPIRPDWPAVHLTKCFVDQEKARLHGSALPLRTYLPPTVSFRNAADVDETIEPEVRPNKQMMTQEGDFEVISTENGIMVQKCVKEGKDGKETQLISLYDFYYGRIENKNLSSQPKAEYRFNCVACQTILYSNVSLMSHVLSHFDETTMKLFNNADITNCSTCGSEFSNAFDLRNHMEMEHMSVMGPDGEQQVYIDTNNGNIICTIACRICEKTCESNFALAYHLQNYHREREMPYRCGICSFYTSLYQDLICHFKKVHCDTNQLICPYCLRTFTVPDAVPINPRSDPSSSAPVGQTALFYQHVKTHKEMLYKHCTSCTLNFVNKTDFELHRKLDHKTQQTSETDSYGISSSSGYITGSAAENSSGPGVSSNDIRDEIFDKHNAEVAYNSQQIKRMNAPEPSRVKDLSNLELPEDIDEYTCLECGENLGNEKHRRYLPCSMCRFASCCANSFYQHVMKMHNQDNKPDNPVHRCGNSQLYFGEKNTDASGIPVDYTADSFFCSKCAISSLDGNSLTNHLVEECGEFMATLKPNPQLLAAREQVEREHVSMDVTGDHAVTETQQIQETSITTAVTNGTAIISAGRIEGTTSDIIATATAGAGGTVSTSNIGTVTTNQAVGGQIFASAIASTDEQQQLMVMEENIQPTSTNVGVVQETEGISQSQEQQQGDDGAYTITLPEGIRLKPHESLVLVILPNGTEEFVIVATADLDSPAMQEYITNNQVSNVILIGSYDDMPENCRAQ